VKAGVEALYRWLVQASDVVMETPAMVATPRARGEEVRLS
jgi:hypothetical protein